MSVDELAQQFATNARSESEIFEDHLRTLGWNGTDNEYPSPEWPLYLAEVVHAAVLQDWAKELIAPDGMRTTVDYEVYMFALQPYVKVGQSDSR